MSTALLSQSHIAEVIIKPLIINNTVTFGDNTPPPRGKKSPFFVS